MKSQWKKRLAARVLWSVLGLSLGLAAGRVSAEEVQWRPAPEGKSSAAQLGQPIHLPRLGPPVLLDTPLPTSAPSVEPLFRRAALTRPEKTARPVARAQMAEVAWTRLSDLDVNTDKTSPKIPEQLKQPRVESTPPVVASVARGSLGWFCPC